MVIIMATLIIMAMIYQYTCAVNSIKAHVEGTRIQDDGDHRELWSGLEFGGVDLRLCELRKVQGQIRRACLEARSAAALILASTRGVI